MTGGGWYLHIKNAQDADVLVLALSGMIVELGRHNASAAIAAGSREEITRARALLTQISDAICRGEFRTI